MARTSQVTPDQVLLLGSHDNFRHLNAHLVEQAQQLPQPLRLQQLYRRWISAMQNHEYYEEHKLYPYLARRWDVSFDAAQRGHHMLHKKQANILNAFRGIQENHDKQAARETLITALKEHENTLQKPPEDRRGPCDPTTFRASPRRVSPLLQFLNPYTAASPRQTEPPMRSLSSPRHRAKPCICRKESARLPSRYAQRTGGAHTSISTSGWLLRCPFVFHSFRQFDRQKPRELHYARQPSTREISSYEIVLRALLLYATRIRTVFKQQTLSWQTPHFARNLPSRSPTHLLVLKPESSPVQTIDGSGMARRDPYQAGNRT